MVPIIDALKAGGALALSFSPLFALVGAVAAACVHATGDGLRRAVAGWGLLVAVWLVGDGMRVVAAARDLTDGASSLVPALPVWANAIALALWGVGGFALAYAVPAWAGAFAGRRVTLGTGWLSAGAVAVALSLAISGSVGSLL